MAIQFLCDACGHASEVDDHLAGRHGTCKHCGRSLLVPHHAESAPAPLRLRPLEEHAPDAHAHLLAAQPELTVRAAETDPRLIPAVITDPDAPTTRPSSRGHGDDYTVLDPFGITKHHSSAGPPPFWVNLPTLTARSLARFFRSLRNWLYVVSLVGLTLALYGYLFQWKLFLHLGAALVVPANLAMLVVGIAYLVTLPFKNSLAQGLLNLFCPPYAVYYWIRHWPAMKTPVLRTLASFLPIALVALAYLVYKEAPIVERELPVLEQKLEDLDRQLIPDQPPSSKTTDNGHRTTDK